MKKKILTLALVLMLLTSCLLPCATAFAQETENNKVGYESLFEYDLDLFLHYYNSSFPEFIRDDNEIEYRDDGSTAFYEIKYYKIWEKVCFEFLWVIPNTPFAELKTVELILPCEYYVRTFTGEQFYTSILVDDFLRYLNFKSFGVLQSNLKEINFQGRFENGQPVFRAIYYDTFYLCAKNSDGNSRNYYLNCNLTLKEFCDLDLNTTKLLPQGIYEIFINDIYNKYYLQLDGRKVEDLYGYWGFCAIPDGNIFNEFFHALGTGTFLSPNIHYFQFIETISNAQDLDLQKSYGQHTFGWILQKLLLFDADFLFKNPKFTGYIVYVEGGDSTIIISKNGSSDLDNNLGAGGNGVVDGIQSIDWGALFTGPVVAGLFVTALVLVVGIIVLKIYKKSKGRKK